MSFVFLDQFFAFDDNGVVRHGASVFNKEDSPAGIFEEFAWKFFSRKGIWIVIPFEPKKPGLCFFASDELKKFVGRASGQVFVFGPKDRYFQFHNGYF